MDTKSYLEKKSGIIFDFLDRDKNGKLSIEDFLHYARQLKERGKLDMADRVIPIYLEYFRRVGQQAGKGESATVLERSDFVKGSDLLRKTEWFLKGFLEPITDLYFDTVDRNQDSRISLGEWRQMYNTRGITDEKFIRSTFAKMDRNGDGTIERSEFKHAFIQFGIGEDQDEDYSFLYDTKSVT